MTLFYLRFFERTMYLQLIVILVYVAYHIQVNKNLKNTSVYITGKTRPFSHFRLIHESIIQGGFFMRKLWFLLSISFILVLAACGFDDNNNNGNDGNNDANNSEDSAEEAKDNTIN